MPRYWNFIQERGDKLSEKIKLNGVLSKGYGLAPKLVMIDQDLSIEAKAIYCYISSFCGNGTTAFPSVELIMHHLGIGKNRFYRYRKELVNKGYIKVHRRREGQKSISNLYELNMNLGFPYFEDIQNEDIQFEDIQNEDTNNNSLNNNSLNNNNFNTSSGEEAAAAENTRVPYEEIKSLYNETCKSLSKIRSMSSNRKEHVKARWKQFNYDIDTFKEVFELVEKSSFLKGSNKRGWKADFDWLIKNDHNMIKVLEGKYQDGGGDNGGGPTEPDPYDNPDIGISL